MKIAYFLTLLTLFISCNNKENNKFSDKEKSEILTTLESRMRVEVEDYASINKKPTNILFLTSSFLLNKERVELYKKQGYIENEDNELEDLIKVKISNYTLINEKHHKLLINDKDVLEVNTSPFFEENKVMYSQFGISIPLTGYYTRLEGNIAVELKIDDKNQIKIILPIKLNISDFF